MLSVRFVAHNSEWTESMKELVHQKIASPLRKRVPAGGELHVHLRKEDPSRYVLWTEMQSQSGRRKELARCRGGEFPALVNEVSSHIRVHLRRRPLEVM
jgi:hypothetical protein